MVQNMSHGTRIPYSNREGQFYPSVVPVSESDSYWVHILLWWFESRCSRLMFHYLVTIVVLSVRSRMCWNIEKYNIITDHDVHTEHDAKPKHFNLPCPSIPCIFIVYLKPTITSLLKAQSVPATVQWKAAGYKIWRERGKMTKVFWAILKN